MIGSTVEFRRTRCKARQIGVIPLIDVAMFLLIFFMVAGTVEKFDIVPVTPPHAESGKLIDEGHIIILLGRHDELVVDDELSDINQLGPYVREKLTTNPNKIITVKADAGIPAVRMIQVMDLIKLAGGRNLSIVTHSQPHATRHP